MKILKKLWRRTCRLGRAIRRKVAPNYSHRLALRRGTNATFRELVESCPKGGSTELLSYSNATLVPRQDGFDRFSVQTYSTAYTYTPADDMQVRDQ